MGKILELSFPYLTKEQKKQFLMIIILLVSYKNELPQGAPTSTRLLNIVMANTDKEILTFLHSDKSNIHNSLYTRYLDDIAVSFKDFKSYVLLEDKLRDTHQNLKSLFTPEENTQDSAVFSKSIGASLETFQELTSISCNFDDEYNVSRVRIATLRLKEQLDTFYQNNPFKDYDIIAESYQKIKQLITEYLKLIN